jgi:hypothetical protein
MANFWEKDAIVQDAPSTTATPWQRDDAVASTKRPSMRSQWAPDVEVDDSAAGQEGETYAQGGVGGINKGLANLVGLPVDGLNALLRALGAPVSDRPFMGSEFIKSGANATLGRATSSGTMFPKGPDDFTGRIINRTGEEIGASLLPAAGIMAKAGQYAPSAFRTVNTAAPTIGRTFFEPIARSPGRAAIGEGAAATGAGIGAGVMQDIAPGNSLAEMGGQFVGGFAPTALANMPAALAARTAAFLGRRLSADAQRDAARHVVKDYTEDQITGQARDRLQESNQVAETIPGFNPSLAERTGAPGLLRKQQELESGFSGTDLDAAVARRVMNEDAINRFADQAAPGYPGDVSVVVDTARRKVDVLKGQIDGAASRADARRRDVAAGLPEADLAAQGARVRAGLQDTVGEENLGFQIYAREAGLDDPSVIVPFQEFKVALKEAFDSSDKIRLAPGQNSPRRHPEIYEKIVRADVTQDFPAIMQMRSELGDTIRNMERSPVHNVAELRGLKAMRATFDDALERAVQQTNDPDIAQRYAGFRKAYLEQVVERLQQRASHEVLHKDAQGAYRLPDEAVVEAYFSPGAITAARQFKSVFGRDASATAALESVALDSLRRTAVRDGVIDPESMKRWLRAHASVLDEFPQIKAKVANIETANEAVLARQADLAARALKVEDSLLNRELMAIHRDESTPQKAIARAMESPRKMGELMGRIRGNPEAKAALRRAVWDKTADLGPGKLAEFVENNTLALKAAGFNDAHFRNLKLIDAARMMTTQVPLPTGSANIPTSADAFLRTFGIRPDVLSNRLHALNTGRTEKSYLFMNVFTNILNRKQGQYMDDAFRVVLYDPVVAQDMANSILRGRMTEPTANRLQARYFALGVTPFKDDEQQQ